MRSILDSQTKRLIEVIEHLSLNEFSNFQDLMQLVNASDKTMLSDLATIEKRWGQQLGMIKYRDIYYFTVKNIAVMHDIYRELFARSLPISFIFALFENPHNRMKYYASNLHVSESSLYRLLPGLNEYLSKSKIKIVSVNGLFHIETKDECQFRNFFASIALQTQYVDDILKQQELEIFDDIFDSFFEFYDPIIDATEASFYKIYYKLAIIREIQGFKGAFKSKLAVDKAFDHLSPRYETLTKDHLKSVHGGFLRIFVPQSQSDIVIQALKNALMDSLHLDLEKEEKELLYKLCADAYTYINFYPYEIATLFNRYDYFAKSFKEQNNLTYMKIKNTIKQFYKVNSPTFYTALNFFVYYLNLYFYPAIRQQQTLKIAVISELGIEHAEFLRQYIQDHFAFSVVSVEDIYTLAFSKSSKEFDTRHYDLILSTAILSNLKKEEYLIINDYPSILDISKINQAIQRPYTNK